MANKQRYDIELNFKANSSGVKAELSNLSNLLNNLTNNVDIMGDSRKSIQSAKQDLVSLRAALIQAVNVDTGKMDLSKFSNSLRRSNTDLTSVRKSLMKMGPEGQAAFTSLAKSIVEAEIPMKRTNKLLSDFVITLKNTAKWQVSSTILQGFTGSIQEAYHYAQDLNKNLNDIRIVSGQNKEQMDKFAKAANKAAKELSTTTNEYTKASLIFYQQGLNDAQVKKRTDTVIKMSNVTGESADDVSSYMTAIWNNFDNGSESLEHYADVITALGAATASSSEEIAGGMEKFAAVANTIGLSYEYAASALATVVAATRQSEDTVGTSFKTIFSRLQSLSLGETLEDSTTLTKYSQALDIAGVKIKEQNGELKDMDTILDELGTKWQYLSKDQQVAIANTVAGTRQYANFIALMDNYGTFRENLGTARDSEGELQKQADIYAESWEAARDRVTTSAETIYDNLLNDEFFIKLTDGFAGVLDMINNISVGAGGLNGILATTAAMILKVKGKEAARGLERIAYNLTPDFVKQAQAKNIKNEAAKELDKATRGGYISEAQSVEIDASKDQIRFQQKIADNAEKISASDREQLEIQMSINKALTEQSKLKAELSEKAVNEYEKARKQYMPRGTEDTKIEQRDAFNTALRENKIAESIKAQEKLSNISNLNSTGSVDSVSNRMDKKIKTLSGLNTGLDKKSKKDIEGYVQKLKELQIKLKGCEEGTEEYKKIIKEFNDKLNDAQDALDLTENAVEDLSNELQNSANLTKEEADNMANAAKKKAIAAEESADAEKKRRQGIEDTEETFEKAINAEQKWSEVTVSAAQGVLGLVGAISQLSSISDIMNDETLSGWDKFSSILSTILTASISLSAVYTGFKPLVDKVVASQAKHALTQTILNQVKKEAGKTEDDYNNELNETSKEYKKLNKQQKQQILNELTGKGGKGGIKAGFKNFGTGFKAGIKGAGKTAVKGGAGAGLGAAGSIGTAVGAALPWVAAAAAIVGVIALGVYVYNTAEREAKKAEASAKAMSEAYEETNRQHKELLSSLKTYEDLQKKIDELAEGTTAWKEAIAEANEETRKLIESQNLVYGQDYEIGEGGRLTLKEGVSERVQQESEERANQALVSSQAANVTAKAKRLEADTVNLRRSINATAYTQSSPGSNYSQVAYTADEALDKILSDKNIDINMLSEDTAFREYINELGYNNGLVVEELVSNREEISKLIETEKAIAAEEIAVMTQALMANNAEAFDIRNGSIIAENVAAETKKGSAAFNNEITRIRKLSNDDLAKEVELVYGGQYKVEDLGGGDLTLKRKNAEGGWDIVGEENDYVKEDFYEMLATQILSSQNVVDTDTYKKAKKQEEQAYTGLQSVLGLTDFSGETNKILTDISGQIIDKDVQTIDLSNLTEQQVEQLQTSLNSNVFEDPEVKNRIQEGINNRAIALAEKLKNQNADWVKGRDDRIINQRAEATSSLEANTEAYTAYRNSIISANTGLEENSDLITQITDRNWKLTAGMKGLNKVVAENYNDVVNYAKGSLEYSKAIGNIASQLKATFGANFDTNWIGENIELIRSAASGDTIALASVQKTAATNILNEANISSETKAGIQDFINSLNPEDLAKAGNTIDLGNINTYAKGINQEELNKIFENLGIQMSSSTGEDGNIKIDSLTSLGNADIAASLGYIAKNDFRDIDETETLSKEYKKLEKNLENIQKAKDKAFGKDKLKQYDAEINAITELENKAVELKEIYTSELAETKDELADFANSQLNLNVNDYIDANGNLNITALKEAAVAGDITPEQLKLLEEYISDYEDWYEKIQNQEEVIIELGEDKIQKQLDKQEYQIELKVAIEERELAYIQHQLDSLDGQVFNWSDRLNLVGQQLANTQSKFQAQWQSNDIYGKINDGTIDAADKEQLDQFLTDYYNFAKEAVDIKRSYEEELTNIFEAYNTKLEANKNSLDNMASTIETYTSIIDITGKNMLGVSNNAIRQMAATNKDIAEKSLQASIATVDSLKEMQENIRIQAESSTEDKDYWQERLDAINQQVEEAEQDMLSSWQEAVQTAADIFAQEMELVAESMEQALSGTFGNLTYLKDHFDQQKEISERFLNDYEKVYEISKLTRDIDNKLAGTQSLKAKHELTSLQEKIRDIQESNTELSEYDLEILQKEYDLRLAEIALEEAQNAKSMVRLQRGADGSLNYVYTADAEKVEQASQKYEDAVYAMQEANSNYANSVQEQIITTQQDMVNSLTEIMNDNSLSIEDRLTKATAMYSFYMDKIRYLGAEFNKIIGNNQALYDSDSANFQNYIGDKVKSLSSFGDTTLGQMMNINNIADLIANIENAGQTAINEATAGANQYINTVNGINGLMNADNMNDYIQNNLNTIDSQSKATMMQLNNNLADFSENIDHVMVSIVDFQSEYLRDIKPVLSTFATVAQDVINKLNAESMSSGGYTGSWGSSGKLAVLHEKELVLNAEDTANILSVVEIVRGMSDKLNGMKAASFDFISNGFNTSTPQTLEQKVEIKAEFPNVTNHTEIEQAFENLVNEASQYANRK